MDKSMIISNLEMLSNYIKKDIEYTNTSIEHWEKRIEEIGEDTIAFPEVEKKLEECKKSA